MATAPHHLIDAKSSYFEQYKSNHYKWRKRMIKYQNGEYIYLYPLLSLININQAGKILICVYFYVQHVVIIIYLQK